MIRLVSFTHFCLPSEYLAVFCSFLMGVGDCCIHNELYSILGSMYPDDSAEVFAVFKFVRVSLLPSVDSIWIGEHRRF